MQLNRAPATKIAHKLSTNSEATEGAIYYQ